MAHLTVYLPDDTEKRVRALAKAEGTTVNRWIATQISKVAERSWSPSFLAAAGADPDFPEMGEVQFGTDTPREEVG